MSLEVLRANLISHLGLEKKMSCRSESGLLPSDIEDSAGPPSSGVVVQTEADAELIAMLAQAARA